MLEDNYINHVVHRMPVYLLVDISASMTGIPIQTVSKLIQSFYDELITSPGAIESVYLSVITFSDSVDQKIPLVPVFDFIVPSFLTVSESVSRNSFQDILKILDQSKIPISTKRKWDFKPLVVLLTNGIPIEVWKAGIALRTKKNLGNIVAIDCNENNPSIILRWITARVLLIDKDTPQKLNKIVFWSMDIDRELPELPFFDKYDNPFPISYQESGVPPTPDKDLFLEMPTEENKLITFSDESTMEIEGRHFRAINNIGDLHYSSDHKYIVMIQNNKGNSVHRSINNENDLFKKNMEMMISTHGPPKIDLTNRWGFTWPEKLVTNPYWGLCIHTLPTGMKPITYYLYPEQWLDLPEPMMGSWKNRVLTCLNLSKGIEWLHSRNLLFYNLNDKKVLVNIEHDYACVLGVWNITFTNSYLGNLYIEEHNKKYSAPEIINKNSSESKETNFYSLAVLIYQLLLLCHPIFGPIAYDCAPEKEQELINGTNAFYVENVINHSNRTGRSLFTSEILTPLIKKMFFNAFIDGLRSPMKRPSATEWIAALTRMVDRIVPCQNPLCMMKAFVFPETRDFNCPWCGTPYRVLSGLPIISLYRPEGSKGSYTSEDWSIVGLQDRQIYRYHADSLISSDEDQAATVIAHINHEDDGRWYLVNDCLDGIRVLEKGDKWLYHKGDRIELMPDMKILLGPEDRSRIAYIQML